MSEHGFYALFIVFTFYQVIVIVGLPTTSYILHLVINFVKLHLPNLERELQAAESHPEAHCIHVHVVRLKLSRMAQI